MKSSSQLPLARFFSFLAFLFMMVNYFMVMVMTGLMPVGNTAFRIAIVPFQFAGMVLGVLFCSLFLSNPRQKKPLAHGIIFIFFTALLNFGIRSFGVDLYTSSTPILAAVSILTGIMVVFCNGLLLLTFSLTPESAAKPLGQASHPAKASINKTGRFCIFFFALAVAAALLVRHALLYMTAISSGSDNPMKTMAFIYSFIKWLMAGIGISGMLCIMLLEKSGVPALGLFSSGQRTSLLEKSNAHRTEWPVILGLIGIIVVSRTLGSIMGIRLLSSFFYSHWEQQYFIVVPAGIITLGILAGYSMRAFMRIFIPIAIILFILLPCIILFNASGKFILILYTLFDVFNHSLWAVFPVALIEYYWPEHSAGARRSRASAPKKPAKFIGLGFYILASVTHLANVFLFLGPMANRFIPGGTEYTVWIIGIAAAAFILLAFRAVTIERKEVKSEVIKITLNTQDPEDAVSQYLQPSTLSFKYGLSGREIEIALLLKEGLGIEKIGEALFISTHTVNNHIAKIYRKCKVKSRGEFLAKVMR